MATDGEARYPFLLDNGLVPTHGINKQLQHASHATMQATWSSMLLANTLKDGALDYMHAEEVRL